MPTPLSKIGEFKLINHLTDDFQLKNPNVIKGIGDDAAVIKTDKGVCVVSTDMISEGVHFDLIYCPPKHLGYKSVVVNLSDIYAMNATPDQITVSLAVSNRMSVEFLEEFYAGVMLACERYNVDLVGGDTVSSKSGLIISVTAIGHADEKDIVYRSGAKQNDLLCVSGDLGAAYMGLQLLEREKSVYNSDQNMQPDLSGYDYILERQLKPEARKEIVELLKKNDIRPTSMIDISDGLSSEILHLCNSSSLGCNIYQDKIPIDPTTVAMAEEFKIAPETAALNGGEDYELLFTIDMKDHEKIKGLPGISVIGHMTGKGEGKYMVTSNGTAIELVAQGWESIQE